MLKYTCDICEVELDDEDLMYDVNIEVRAKYKRIEIDLSDLLEDHMEEIKQLIEKTKDLSAEKLQNSVYKSFSFHLCPACQMRYLKDPLGRKTRNPAFDKRFFGNN